MKVYLLSLEMAPGVVIPYAVYSEPPNLDHARQKFGRVAHTKAFELEATVLPLPPNAPPISPDAPEVFDDDIPF